MLKQLCPLGGEKRDKSQHLWKTALGTGQNLQDPKNRNPKKSSVPKAAPKNMNKSKSPTEREKEYKAMRAAIFGNIEEPSLAKVHPPILKNLIPVKNTSGKSSKGVRGDIHSRGCRLNVNAQAFVPRGVSHAQLERMPVKDKKSHRPVKTRVIYQSDREHQFDPDFNRNGVRRIDQRVPYYQGGTGYAVPADRSGVYRPPISCFQGPQDRQLHYDPKFHHHHQDHQPRHTNDPQMSNPHPNNSYSNHEANPYHRGQRKKQSSTLGGLRGENQGNQLRKPEKSKPDVDVNDEEEFPNLQ
eukprot:1372084-Amorphochlora_amoeboformis.AAC.1